MSAPSSAFTGSVKYSDGVTISVGSVVQGTETGVGPGVFQGDPTTQLTIKLTNGSKAAINLNQVVVRMVYGHPARLAMAVYDASAEDFSGTVVPGKTATAVYVFSIPTVDLANVTMTVDFDGKYKAATFTGSVK